MASRTALRALPRLRAGAPVSYARRWASSAPGQDSSSSSSGSSPSESSTSASASGSGQGSAPPTRDAAKDLMDDKPNPYEVPMLGRPLGTPVPPSSAEKSWKEKRERLLDKDRRKAERKLLIKEAGQGYFHDYNLARKANGGKLWVAPPVLIREDRALYFPDISGKALTGQVVHTTDMFKGKVSLVTILNTRISEEHIQSFVEPVLEDWEAQPVFNYVQINHQANPLKSMLLSFFVSSLKRTIPESRWGTYMISTGEWSEIDITGPLGIENKILGYVYLVDENGKVRWAGCGTAQPEETENLRRAAAVLVRRMLDKEKDGK